MEPNSTIFIVLSAASLGFIYMLIGAFRFSKRAPHREIRRFDRNGVAHQYTDFIGNHHDNISSDFGGCSDSSGDGGCD